MSLMVSGSALQVQQGSVSYWRPLSRLSSSGMPLQLPRHTMCPDLFMLRMRVMNAMHQHACMR